MVFIIVALFVIGFFFPPVWLALVAYIIYLFASRKSRRDEAIEGRIKAMVSSKTSRATFDKLYFESARSFAIAKGARMPEQDVASAQVLVDGRRYFATFLRTNSGGTEILLDTASAVEEKVTAHLDTEDVPATVTSRPIFDALDRLAGNNTPRDFAVRYLIRFNNVDLSALNAKPSWFEARAQVEDFFRYFAEESTNVGVPETYILLSLNEKPLRGLILSSMREAEAEGFDLVYQREVAVALIEKLWDRLDDTHKEQFKALPSDSVDWDAFVESRS